MNIKTLETVIIIIDIGILVFLNVYLIKRKISKKKLKGEEWFPKNCKNFKYCDCCGKFTELKYNYYNYECCSQDCVDVIEMELSPYAEDE